MKDIEELKSWFEDDKLYVGEYVKHKINQLDEPEVLSHELPVVPTWFDEWWKDVYKGEGNLLHNIAQFHDKIGRAHV